MFVISEATMINKGDKLVLTLKTNNVSFDKLYLGKNDDLAKNTGYPGNAGSKRRLFLYI